MTDTLILQRGGTEVHLIMQRMSFQRVLVQVREAVLERPVRQRLALR